VKVVGKRVIGYRPSGLDGLGNVNLVALHAPGTHYPKPKRLPRQRPQCNDNNSREVMTVEINSDSDSSDEDELHDADTYEVIVDSDDEDEDDELWVPPVPMLPPTVPTRNAHQQRQH
jgi:hypothetical protein